MKKTLLMCWILFGSFIVASADNLDNEFNCDRKPIMRNEVLNSICRLIDNKTNTRKLEFDNHILK